MSLLSCSLVGGQCGDFAGSQVPPSTRRQAGKADITNTDSGQLADRVAKGGEHPAHLTVAAFKNCQLDLRLPGPIGSIAFAVTLVTPAKAHILGGLSRTVFQVDATAQNIQRLLCGNAAHFRPVRFRDMVTRVCQAIQKLAIVGEKNQAFRIDIQPPDRAQHRLIAQIHEVRDEAGGVGVLQRRHHSARLIQRDIVPLARNLYWPTVESDPVDIQVHFRAQLSDDLPVNFDPTLGDPRLAGAARADPGGCERFLKPF